MRIVFSFLILILLVLVVGLLGIALLMGWAVGLGWLLTQLVSFTLFEASLLAMMATAVVGFVAWRIFSIKAPAPDWPENGIDDEDEYPIPESRFLADAPGRTGEVHFRYELANELFLDIRANAKMRNMMGEKQLEELAIRLVDVMVAIWKTKRIQGRRVSVTVDAMKKQMEKMGQRPYDEDILQTAVFSANQLLSYDEDMINIVVEKRWNELLEW